MTTTMGLKMAVAGIASILLVACVVADDSKEHGTFHKAVHGAAHHVASAATKSMKTVCDATDFKHVCESSLASAHNVSDPKELIKVAFNVAVDNITDVISKSSLLKEAAKDPRTSGALEICKEVLDDSIDDLKRSIVKLDGHFHLNKIKDYAEDLKVWLSGAITQQQTCIDAFQNTTGDAGEKMKHLLKTAGELTSNGLAMIDQFTSLIKTFDFPDIDFGFGSDRKLLENDENSEDHPLFVDHSARELLAAHPASIKPDITVAQDGSGRFRTINGALSAVPAKNSRTFVIFIKAGIYREQVFVTKQMKKVVFLGEGPLKTRITGNKNFVDGIGTYKTATVAVQGDGFIARDIGFENSAGAIKHQAVALRVSADGAIFYNCHMDGYQDTLYAHSYRQYYRDCTITGTIDFIFGDAAVVFQNCKMIVRKPMENQGCMVTAQGRKDHRGVGATILQNCQILPDPALKTVHPPVDVYLGRPWKEYSRTIIMQSYIDGFISPEGWSPWMGTFALDTLWYAEYQNRGPGAKTTGRVNWKGYKKNITPQIAHQFTPGVFFQGDTWIRPTGIPYDSGMMKL